MRGHEKIILARSRGNKPPVINIIDFPFNQELEPTEVVVHGDRLIDLDLRFVLDCLVTISCEDETRMDWLTKTCEKHGARQVAAGIYRKHYE